MHSADKRFPFRNNIQLNVWPQQNSLSKRLYYDLLHQTWDKYEALIQLDAPNIFTEIDL